MDTEAQRARGGALEVRPLRAGDDFEAEIDLQARAFGPVTGADREWLFARAHASAAESRLFGAWADGRLVGSARFYETRQWWGGHALPMAAVGGVKVAPEVRGRGVGRTLMTGLLGAMAGRGCVLSVLYPATARPYRALGWEFAGGLYRAEIPARSLRVLLEPDGQIPSGPPAPPGDAGRAAPPGAGGSGAIRRAGPDDAGAVIATLGAAHAAARDHGPCTFDPGSVRQRLADPEAFAYLAPDGFLSYGWRGSDREIMVHALVAASAGTARELWGIVASHASVTEVVHVSIGPRDPVGWLVVEDDLRVRRHEHWMLRVLDARAAIAGRGFPAGVQVRVPLLLADRELPAQAGPHELTVSGGEGRLDSWTTGRPGGSPAAGPVRLGARGFAALFAGVPMATLRVAGLVAGGDAAADEALDAVFGCSPYLLDYF